jgi:hypothetical protein
MTIRPLHRLRIDLRQFRSEHGAYGERGSMKYTRAIIALAAAFACATPMFAEDWALAQGAAPANTLVDLQRQFGACMSGKSVGPAGSRLTIMLMMKRDGSIFGKPRITFSHLEGDKEARQAFVDDAERAVEACLPFRITPSLGGAIAGRPFVVTLGSAKAEQGI